MGKSEELQRKARFFCPPKGKKMCQEDHFDRKKVRAAAPFDSRRNIDLPLGLRV
jgi:hypothetical protein